MVLGHRFLSLAETCQCDEYYPLIKYIEEYTMVDLFQEPEFYSRIIHESEDGYEQIRLVVNTFYGKEYLHFRKYYLDFEGEWQATKQGVSMPLDLSNSREMFAGLVELLSLTENKAEVYEYFKDVIEDSYS